MQKQTRRRHILRPVVIKLSGRDRRRFHRNWSTLSRPPSPPPIHLLRQNTWAVIFFRHNMCPTWKHIVHVLNSPLPQRLLEHQHVRKGIQKRSYQRWSQAHTRAYMPVLMTGSVVDANTEFVRINRLSCKRTSSHQRWTRCAPPG